jgi:hypothetical protein
VRVTAVAGLDDADRAAVAHLDDAEADAWVRAVVAARLGRDRQWADASGEVALGVAAWLLGLDITVVLADRSFRLAPEDWGAPLTEVMIVARPGHWHGTVPEQAMDGYLLADLVAYENDAWAERGGRDLNPGQAWVLDQAVLHARVAIEEALRNWPVDDDRSGADLRWHLSAAISYFWRTRHLNPPRREVELGVQGLGGWLDARRQHRRQVRWEGESLTVMGNSRPVHQAGLAIDQRARVLAGRLLEAEEVRRRGDLDGFGSAVEAVGVFLTGRAAAGQERAEQAMQAMQAVLRWLGTGTLTTPQGAGQADVDGWLGRFRDGGQDPEDWLGLLLAADRARGGEPNDLADRVAAIRDGGAAGLALQAVLAGVALRRWQETGRLDRRAGDELAELAELLEWWLGRFRDGAEHPPGWLGMLLGVMGWGRGPWRQDAPGPARGPQGGAGEGAEAC